MVLAYSFWKRITRPQKASPDGTEFRSVSKAATHPASVQPRSNVR